MLTTEWNLEDAIDVARKEANELAKKAEKERTALEMLRDGLDSRSIAKYTKLSLEKIQSLAKQNKLI